MLIFLIVVYGVMFHISTTMRWFRLFNGKQQWLVIEIRAYMHVRLCVFIMTITFGLVAMTNFHSYICIVYVFLYLQYKVVRYICMSIQGISYHERHSKYMVSRRARCYFSEVLLEIYMHLSFCSDLLILYTLYLSSFTHRIIMLISCVLCCRKLQKINNLKKTYLKP